MTLHKNWYYETCIKFPVYYSKKAIQYSLSRVWLDASKILSKTKANSGKNSAGIGTAEVVQTLEWSGPRLPGWDGTAWLWAKASIKKSNGQKQHKNNTWSLAKFSSQSPKLWVFPLSSFTACTAPLSPSAW